MKPISITREELYEKVWSLPTIQLTETFGISDVAIAKLCNKLHVPKPPRGYWNKLRHGQHVLRPPLPPLADAPAKATIHGQPPTTILEPEQVTSPAAFGAPIDLKSAHPLVKKTLQALKKAKIDRWGAGQYGRVTPSEPGCLNVSVSTEGIERAMQIMASLINGLQAAGYSIEVSAPDPARHFPPQTMFTYAVIDGERLQFHLEETAERRPHALTEKEKANPIFAPKWDYVPSNKMKLIIDEYGGELRRNWTFRKDRPHDIPLASFVDGLVAMATAVKRIRIERKRQEEEWAAARQRETEQLARIEQLKVNAAAWGEATKYRRFIAALESEGARTSGTPINPESRLGQWITWAKKYIDSIDPVVQTLKSDKGSAA